MAVTDRTAAYWLDKACAYENEGETKKANMALNAALKQDIDENPKSLPRK